LDDDQDNHQGQSEQDQGEQDTKLSSAAQGHDLSRSTAARRSNDGSGRRARSSLTKVDTTLGESVKA
jgi:hypothetical protein